MWWLVDQLVALAYNRCNSCTTRIACLKHKVNLADRLKFPVSFRRAPWASVGYTFGHLIH